MKIEDGTAIKVTLYTNKIVTGTYKGLHLDYNNYPVLKLDEDNVHTADIYLIFIKSIDFIARG